MSAVDIIAVIVFFAFVGLGIVFTPGKSLLAETPRARIRQRLLENVAEVAPVAAENDDDTATKRRMFGADTRAAQMLMALKQQIEHMGGAGGIRTITLVSLVSGVAGAIAAHLADLGPWIKAAAFLPAAAAGGYAGYTIMIGRYRKRFLNGFPDALDLMIRAVRAGVPVVHAIVTAGKELPYPVGREFRIMGDSLRIGMDQQDVMEAASKRIGIPDFQFFVVCLQLQRETGGALAETLENLSAIIRARREVRQKTRALTAQGRAASQIIACVPFVVVGALKMVGGDYMDIIFETEKGLRLLWIAIGLIVVGLTIISRMSRLED